MAGERNSTGPDSRPVIVPIGGFLGAGKTTLILAAARVLKQQGIRAAAILNDQGSDLVDTSLARQNEVIADQVTGGCFCCRFSELVNAAERVRRYAPEVIFAEAVGSCTDLSATTVQPLRRAYGDRFRVAPFSVLVDPARALELLAEDADRDLAFLFRNQIAEADLLCFTKADLPTVPPEMPGLPVRIVSAPTGQGVPEWLHEVLAGELALRNAVLDIDYSRYARAEAALSWLNCRATTRIRVPLSPAMLAGPLLERLRAELSAAGVRIVHMKLLNECASGYIKASICANRQEPRVEGALDAAPCTAHDLLLNIRALGDPSVLRRIVESELGNVNARTAIHSLECFRPAAPKPERRVTAEQ